MNNKNLKGIGKAEYLIIDDVKFIREDLVGKPNAMVEVKHEEPIFTKQVSITYETCWLEAMLDIKYNDVWWIKYHDRTIKDYDTNEWDNMDYFTNEMKKNNPDYDVETKENNKCITHFLNKLVELKWLKID